MAILGALNTRLYLNQIGRRRRHKAATATESRGGKATEKSGNSPTGPESPYLTPPEAARYLRLASAHSLRQATKKFGIPHIRLGGRLFYTKQQLDEFMAVATEATAPVLGRRRRR
jgi:hypothetical protein